MVLDVLTPKGQETVAQEDEAASLLFAHRQIRYVRTPKDGPAAVDAVLTHDAHGLCAVAEMKCRQMTHEGLIQDYDGEWLITYDKVLKLCDAARLLGVPGMGLLYLVPDRILLTIKICDHNGELSQQLIVKRTPTQATVNGGQAMRVNAYVPMHTAKVYR